MKLKKETVNGSYLQEGTKEKRGTEETSDPMHCKERSEGSFVGVQD